MATTTEIMKELIAKKVEFDNAMKAEKEKNLNEEKHSLEEKIISYRYRLQAMIDIAEYALKNGIPLTGKAWGGHEGYDTHQFFSNSWSHLLGFVKNDYGIFGMGIIAGGACGNINLYFDGYTVYGETAQWNYKTNKTEYLQVDPPYNYLKRCANEFDEFEREFYAYIEKVCTSTAPIKK